MKGRKLAEQFFHAQSYNFIRFNFNLLSARLNNLSNICCDISEITGIKKPANKLRVDLFSLLLTKLF